MMDRALEFGFCRLHSGASASGSGEGKIEIDKLEANHHHRHTIFLKQTYDREAVSLSWEPRPCPRLFVVATPTVAIRFTG